jgi:hypothetical protein
VELYCHFPICLHVLYRDSCTVPNADAQMVLYSFRTQNPSVCVPIKLSKFHPRTDHEGPEGGVEVLPYSFFNIGARLCGSSSLRPGRFTLEKETRYPLYRRLGGPQSRSGRVRNLSPPPGFDPRTVPVRSESLYRLGYPGSTIILV